MSTPAIVINGTSGAYEQPQKFGVDSAGPYCIRTWKGTAAAIADQYNVCVAGSAQAYVESGFGTHTCTARYAVTIGGTGAGEVPIDTWEFFASHVEKDLLNADLAVINGISSTNKWVLRQLIDNPSSVTTDEDGSYFEDDGSRADAESLRALMEAGVRAVRANTPTLRHTQTVSNLYAVKAALTDVGKILSSATLATFEGIPTSVLFNLPMDVSTRDGLSYGWMKLHPTIRTGARQKMQIELEYEYDLWSVLLYGAPI